MLIILKIYFFSKTFDHKCIISLLWMFDTLVWQLQQSGMFHAATKLNNKKCHTQSKLLFSHKLHSKTESRKFTVRNSQANSKKIQEANSKWKIKSNKTFYNWHWVGSFSSFWYRNSCVCVFFLLFECK